MPPWPPTQLGRRLQRMANTTFAELSTDIVNPGRLPSAYLFACAAYWHA
jgi:hypothetical protein